VTCCYARGNKHWTRDPQGISWEAFHTLENVPVVDEIEPPVAAKASATGCCAPAGATARAAKGPACCG